MSKQGRFLRRTTDSKKRPSVAFYCPGCKCSHMVCVEPVFGVDGPVWELTNGKTGPTIRPSVRVSDGQGTECHLFVTDGSIQYLNDCRHQLAGKTVPMEEE